MSKEVVAFLAVAAFLAWIVYVLGWGGGPPSDTPHNPGAGGAL